MNRFLTLHDVAAELSISHAQAYAMVRCGNLPAMQVGGRGQWRIERKRFEQWVEAEHAAHQDAPQRGRPVRASPDIAGPQPTSPGDSRSGRA